jgi:threonine synthase
VRRAGLAWVAEGPTLAEGIRVSFPLRGDEILRTLETNQGLLVAVDEENILPGWRELAQRGLYVEPTSAVVWNAMAQLADRLRDPVVAVLTGSGLKWAG